MTAEGWPGSDRPRIRTGSQYHRQPAEEHVNVISVDTVNQTFTAIVTMNHPAGSSIRTSIWPTAMLLEGNDLAFDIKAVASPDPGSDLTVVAHPGTRGNGIISGRENEC